jgi:hypothetical protein
MAGFQIEREESSGVITLNLMGTFDGTSAQQLRASLEKIQGHPVVVDFSRVRGFADSAVAILTGDLDFSSVRLRGLARHHETMFRYFGIASSSGSTPKPYYTPEDVLAL